MTRRSRNKSEIEGESDPMRLVPADFAVDRSLPPRAHTTTTSLHDTRIDSCECKEAYRHPSHCTPMLADDSRATPRLHFLTTVLQVCGCHFNSLACFKEASSRSLDRNQLRCFLLRLLLFIHDNSTPSVDSFAYQNTEELFGIRLSHYDSTWQALIR